MNKRKWTVSLSALLLVVLSVTGYFAISAEYGSKEDPLVTVGYINDVLSPQTMAEIQKALDAQKAEFDEQINAKVRLAVTEIEQKLADYKSQIGGSAPISDDVIDAIADQVIAKMGDEGIGGGGGGSTGENSWAVVKIPAGKKLIGQVGCEIVLRIGSATCVAPGTPGLINLSSGAELQSGGALAQNNLYLVTVKERGLTSAAGCTVLVNGTYTIG